MSTAYFPVISCVFFPFSPLLLVSHPPVTFLKQEQFCISAQTGNKSFYQECILMDSMLHLSHQNLNCIIFNFFYQPRTKAFY